MSIYYYAPVALSTINYYFSKKYFLSNKKRPPRITKGVKVRGKCIVRLYSRATFVYAERNIVIVIHRVIVPECVL